MRSLLKGNFKMVSKIAAWPLIQAAWRGLHCSTVKVWINSGNFRSSSSTIWRRKNTQINIEDKKLLKSVFEAKLSKKALVFKRF